MLKALVVLLWPVGIAVSWSGTALLASGYPPARRRSAAMNGHGGGEAAVAPRSARSSIVGMLLILVVGAVAVYALTCLLGVLVVHAGPDMDKPFYSWMSHHRVHAWKSVMNRLTKVGNTWTTWGAAAAAAACLAAFYRRRKWLPPVVLGAAIFIDHYLTLALRHTFHRLGPPDSPLGTFPSGGCDRIILFYGLIAYLIWREASGRRHGGLAGRRDGRAGLHRGVQPGLPDAALAHRRRQRAHLRRPAAGRVHRHHPPGRGPARQAAPEPRLPSPGPHGETDKRRPRDPASAAGAE